VSVSELGYFAATNVYFYLFIEKCTVFYMILQWIWERGLLYKNLFSELTSHFVLIFAL